ncbi:inverse autotransporter beta-barrel domain-containing protein [Xenorhabdus beddingii]|uniref:Inverse autotransporter beta-barrel domain-containing protein n=1 Tax=Xenorhabdus beddingii TaxID=40578 RepID=A0A1Y2SN85_9GAMM|nr:Ig-like domain-containing protein [Xenorhabdus beddingii]OTA19144.1 inverse autotransporter beta-barrel domain-containing protein [Xenorhabdus beddingii]
MSEQQKSLTTKLMDFSLRPDADLIKGQSFPLTIQLKSTSRITVSLPTIIFSQSKNITPPNGNIILYLSQDQLTATTTVMLTVNSNIKSGEKILFTVSTNVIDFTPQNFQCTPKDIDPETLVLTVDNKFLDLPSKPPTSINGPCPSTPGATYCTKVHTVIKDPDHQPLSGVPVLITDNMTGNLNKFLIFDVTSNQVVTPTADKGFGKIYINSDSSGNVVFYLYSLESLSAVLHLYSMIEGQDPTFYPMPATTPIYAISANLQSPNYLWWPEIYGLTSKTLISDGSEYFWVNIAKYDQASSGDIIIFYINGQPTDHIVNIRNPDKQLGNYAIKLPYGMFQHGEEISFSYIVIFIGGTIEISYKRKFTYMGEKIPNPIQNLTVSPPSPILVNDIYTLKVNVKDVTGKNPATNKKVNWIIKDSDQEGITLNPTSGTTDLNGDATTTLTSTQARSVTVVASVEGIETPKSVDVEFKCPIIQKPEHACNSLFFIYNAYFGEIK